MAEPHGPLQGVKVVACSTAQAGTVPYMLMADLGAEVTKIEVPGVGDNSRGSTVMPGFPSTYFETNNRGVKSVTLNLKESEGRDILKQLVAQTGIFGQNFRPGAAEKNGFGYEELRLVNPRLVYMSISGYGPKGPHADLPGTDSMAQALGGIAQAYSTPGQPLRTGIVSVADETCAILAFGGALAALTHARATGVGQKVDCSLLGGQIRLMGWTLTTAIWRDRDPVTGQARITGTPERPGISASFNDRNGKPLVFQLNGAGPWRNAMTALGFYEALEKAGFGDLGLIINSDEKRRSLLRMLDELFATGSRDDWVERLRGADIVSAPINTLLEGASDPDVLANGYVTEIDYKKHGKRLRCMARSGTSPRRRRASEPPPSWASTTTRCWRGLATVRRGSPICGSARSSDAASRSTRRRWHGLRKYPPRFATVAPRRAPAVDFALTPRQLQLRRKCRELAADFATRSAAHDRDASHPSENYERLRQEGFLALTVAEKWGGGGASLLDHTVAYEALGQGCPSTALAFNMHASVVMPMLESPEVPAETKKRLAQLVVRERKLIAGNFSEPVTTSLIGARPIKTRARRVAGGYRVTGRKMFASMLEAADLVMVGASIAGAGALAGMVFLLPRVAEGRRVDANWDVLGMRATRSDSLILEECFVPDSAVLYRSDDMSALRQNNLHWFWGSYTPVYLGVAQAAYDELRRVVGARKPEGYAQPLAYHPDVRRQVAEMSAEIGAARLVTYHSAWLADSEGLTKKSTAALYRAKYLVGEAVSRVTRTALTLSGAHGVFKPQRLEQLFRDGALGPLHPPPADFCLYNMGLYELGLDPADVLPPLKPA